MIISTEGLEAYWSFNNESVSDGSVNNRDITGLGNMLWANGIYNTALSFVDRSVVRYASRNSLDFSTKTEFSISLWASKTDVTGVGSIRLLSWYIGIVQGIIMYVPTGTNNLSLYFARSGASEIVTINNAFDSTAIRHFVVTFNLLTKDWILYRDDIVIGSGTLVNTPVMPNTSLMLGNDVITPSSTIGWVGGIDEVRIYSRVLTPTEVSQLYSDPGQISPTTPSDLIRIVEYANPETVLPKMIQEYFKELGYSSIYPNFNTLRIGAIHPFALLLFQDITNQSLDLSVFPSITVSDTSDSEVFDELGRGYVEMSLDADDIATIVTARQDGFLLLSDESVSRLQQATMGGEKVIGKQRRYKANHNIDLNIWSENKDMTGMLYDMVKHFVMGNIHTLHEKGIDVLSPLTGRRSGDINVEFGKILFGANITVPVTIETASMIVDMPLEALETVTVQPDFHVTGGL